MDYRSQWKDHAARLQKDIGLPPKDHPQSASILPLVALSVELSLLRLVFVNTPMLFDTIWAKITPFIAKETLEKVIMIGD